MAAGIEVRKGPRGTKYRVAVWSPRDGRLIRKSFDSLAQAKSWRVDAQKALQDGVLRPPSKLTVRTAATGWLEDARAGRVRTRSGKRFKPSTLRGYDRVLRLRVLPSIGEMQLTEVRRRHVQDLVDRLIVAGDTPSTVRNTLDPVRSLFRWALRREEIAVNPTRDVEVPADDGGDTRRAADPAEIPALLEPCPSSTGRCGLARSTPVCGEASCASCAGRTSTSTTA
jgi:integrase